jgi:hypothetical protein
VKGNLHARFWSRGEGSDPLVDCNLTAYSVRSCVAPASSSSSPGAFGDNLNDCLGMLCLVSCGRVR